MKWLGALFLSSGVALVCGQLLCGVRQLQRFLQDTDSFLKMLSFEIGQLQTPLPAVCQKAEEAGYYSRAFWARTRREGLAVAFSADSSFLRLPKELQKEILSFFLQLGKSNLQIQMTACERMMALLRTACETQQIEGPKQKKLYLTVCVCIGAGLLILLL